MSKELEPQLQFQCHKGHSWSVSYKKCIRVWCKKCKNATKLLAKEKIAQDNQAQECKRRFKQEKMLREARDNMLKEQFHKEEEKVSNIDTFRILEEEITKIAAKYARDYVRTDSRTDFNSIVGLYKVLILPEKSMRLYFEALSAKDLKKEFRHYTIMLHPDKNSHPKSKSAF